MSNNYHIGCSPLTNRIYSGTITKSKVWGSKQDLTGAAIGAVCEHVIANGEPVIVTLNGTPKYKVIVEELT